jgi:hypothetical protein
MMKKQETERQLLALALRGEAKLTPALVAYRLELPLAEAKARLDEMTSQGVLELESDERGGLRYALVGAERLDRDEPPPRVVSAPPPPSIFAFLTVLAALITVVHLLLALLPAAGLLGVAYGGMTLAGYLAARQLIRWTGSAPRSTRAD